MKKRIEQAVGRLLHRAIGPLYLTRLVSSPRGRATLLAFMADAEESDEHMVFETLLARVDDAALEKMVRKHRDDEVRHAELLRGAAARAGAAPEPLPRDLRIVLRIDRLLGGVAASFAAKEGGVMEAYALLQVIEERAVSEFPAIARALRAVDPESAAVVEQVVRDEERHVKYAKAISQRYAPDASTLERTLMRMRAVERIAFGQHQQAFLRFAVEHDLLAAPRAERWLWRALAGTNREAGSLAEA